MKGARPIRVLYVTHTGVAGGASRSLEFLIENLPAGAVDPVVMTPEGRAADGFRRIGAVVHPIPRTAVFISVRGVPLKGVRLLTLAREFSSLRHGRRIRRLMQAIAPDIVHLNERGMVQAARIAADLGIPVVQHCRSQADHGNPLVNYFDRVVRRCATKVVCIDESVRRSMRHYGECELIYNPLPFPNVEPRAEKAPNAPVTAAFLCGLTLDKGIWDLMRAARLLKDRKDIQIHVYGGNVRPPEFYRSWFGRMCAAVGLAPDLERVVQDWVEHEGLQSSVKLFGHVTPDPTLFQRMDINVFPTHLSGVGRSVFEAGVFGVPSIVAMNNPVEDIVQNGKTAVVVPVGDPRALADALVRLADDPSLRRTLGENARRRFLQQFDAQVAGRRMLEVYRSVLHERRNKSRTTSENSVGAGSRAAA